MVPISDLRQFHIGNVCILATLVNYNKNYDAYNWHEYYEFICLKMDLDNSTLYFETTICIRQFY